MPRTIKQSAMTRLTVAVFGAAIVACVARASDACPIRDLMYVASGGTTLSVKRDVVHRRNERVIVLPPNPSVYVHLGGDGPPGMPTFTRLDGTAVPTRQLGQFETPWRMLGDDRFSRSFVRVDIEVDAGVVVSKTPDDRLSDIYLITASYVPTTRWVASSNDGDARGLRMDSDAALFRVERADGSNELVIGWDYIPLPEEPIRRVVAIYPDRSEEVIFPVDRSERQPHLVWIVLTLLSLCVIGRRGATAMTII